MKAFQLLKKPTRDGKDPLREAGTQDQPCTRLIEMEAWTPLNILTKLAGKAWAPHLEYFWRPLQRSVIGKTLSVPGMKPYQDLS